MNKNLNRNIFFHVHALKKVSRITRSIINLLEDRKVDEAITQINNRERLLNIVFELHRSIESGISNTNQFLNDDYEFLKAWARDVETWSNNQAIQNEEIEVMLVSIKKETTAEIASIFDKKSRHKGYDLSNLK